MSPPSPSLEHLATSCLFCEPATHGQADQILLASEHFYLFAGLGPIADGYVIIAPDRCDRPELQLRTLAEIPSALLDELVFLRALVARFHKAEYGRYGMAFEHGRAGACVPRDGGTLHCHHAHLACYPVNFDIAADITSPSQEPDNLHDLSRIVGTSPYLYVENSVVDDALSPDSALHLTWRHTTFALGDDAKLESQFLRRCLASRLGRPELWDWAEYPRADSVAQLIDRFATWLRRNGERYDISHAAHGPPRISFLSSVSQSNVIGNDTAAPSFHQRWNELEQYGSVGRFLRQLPARPHAVSPESARPRVLDAGCGPGRYSRAFYALGIECIGIDTSQAMLDLATGAPSAEAEGSLQRVAPPRFVNMDIVNLDFPPDSFEGAWYSAVLVHIPRSVMPRLLEAAWRVLSPSGLAYFSFQLGSGTIVRPEGRVFFYYLDEEFEQFLCDARFEIVEAWGDVTSIGTFGDTRDKKWRHYLVRKRRPRPSPPAESLVHLGERGVLAAIQSWLPRGEAEVVLGVGDDAALVRVPPGELLVATTDPCPLPVMHMLGDRDPWLEGWFSMAINLSDLGAMGARPLGILLAIEAPEDTSIARLQRFYDGVIEASREFDCPVIGGNLKDSARFACVGTALGSVTPDRMLRRDAARAGERIMVVGELGRFWAGAIHRICGIPLSDDEADLLLASMRRPFPLLREGRALAELGITQCAIDASDGVGGCLEAIARASGVDLHVDFSDIVPDAAVATVAAAAAIDVRKLFLAWGDWQLVCTVPDESVARAQAAMRKFGRPTRVIGWVSEGQGVVWYHDETATGRLTSFASERFSARSYFSHGLEQYVEMLRDEPLYRDEDHVP